MFLQSKSELETQRKAYSANDTVFFFCDFYISFVRDLMICFIEYFDSISKQKTKTKNKKQKNKTKTKQNKKTKNKKKTKTKTKTKNKTKQTQKQTNKQIKKHHSFSFVKK